MAPPLYRTLSTSLFGGVNRATQFYPRLTLTLPPKPHFVLSPILTLPQKPHFVLGGLRGVNAIHTAVSAGPHPLPLCYACRAEWPGDQKEAHFWGRECLTFPPKPTSFWVTARLLSVSSVLKIRCHMPPESNVFRKARSWARCLAERRRGTSSEWLMGARGAWL